MSEDMNYKLPPLPETGYMMGGKGYSGSQMQAYAIAAIEAQSVPAYWHFALKRIADWDCHDPMLGVDYGSNGVRDFYRQIAQDALASAPPAPQAKPQPLSADRDARIAELERELEKEKQYVKEMNKDRDHWMTVAAERALLLDKNRKVNKPLSDYEFDEIG